MRILLIAYLYPPFQDPQALRWYYLSNALCENGCEIDVLTVRNPMKDYFSSYHPNLRILRAYPGPIEAIALKKRSLMQRDGIRNRKKKGSTDFRILKAGYLTLRYLFSLIFPGDVRTEWFPYALRYISGNLDLGCYDWMITSHEPWVDSLLGLFLKKRYGVKWVADFGDPYVAPYTARTKIVLETRLERAVYRNADVLIVTSSELRDLLLTKYQFLQEKPILLVRQGFPKWFLNQTGIKSDQADKSSLRIFYAGTFYEDFRNPVPLFKAVSSLRMQGFKIDLYVAGRNEGFEKYLKDSNGSIKFLGFVPHNEIPRHISKSHVLLCMTNRMKTQIPGKFFEYLGTDKPILCISYDFDNEVVRLMKELSRGWVCKNDEGEIQRTLIKIYEAWVENYDLWPRLSPLIDYSYESQAEKLLTTLRLLKNPI